MITRYQLIMTHQGNWQSVMETDYTYPIRAEMDGKRLCYSLPEEYTGYEVRPIEVTQ